MKTLSIFFLSFLTTINVDLFAQNNLNLDKTKNGKTLFFKKSGHVDSTKANISGFVYDCKNNLGIGNANLIFYNDKNLLNPELCVTDSNGYFYHWISSGNYDIRFTAIAYLRYEIKNVIIDSCTKFDSKFCLFTNEQY